MNTINHKSTLRECMRNLRDRLDPEYREAQSLRICRDLLTYIQANNFAIIHTYLPMGSEVNVTHLIQSMLDLNLVVVISKTLAKRELEHHHLVDLQNTVPGKFGTRYPAEPNLYTGVYGLILVPGLAFDHHGNRIGYGAGYYDTFLRQHPEAIKAGVCFPEQMVPGVPAEAHDVRLDLIFF